MRTGSMATWFLVGGTLLAAGCTAIRTSPSSSASGPCPTGITLRPIPAPGPGRIGFLGFEVHAPWLDGHVLMRMPETLSSQLGLHFIDHERPDMPPLSVPTPYPAWSLDEATGAWSYSQATPEGISYGGRAWIDADGCTVQCEFSVTNDTDRTVAGFTNQQCLVFSHAKACGEPNTLATTYTWIDGEWTCLDTTTPTAAEKGRARGPWILMPVAGGPPDMGGMREMEGGWWVVDQVADRNLIARETVDGRHLVAVTWDDPTPPLLMSNTWIPCLHAGPMDPATLEPGETYVWRGRIYFVPNDPAALLRRFLAHKHESPGSGVLRAAAGR